ncbi:hypothetical protein [Shewanella sp. GXUN23E]|uniref:hypothetical protein n=1 Tax=Shewanella sp. GXUN23E TaxID=3422498 RepID=UPI003D7DCDA3
MRTLILLLVTGIVFTSFNTFASGSQAKSLSQSQAQDVVATPAMDKQAQAILASLPRNNRIEQARAVMRDGTLVHPTHCTNHSCSFALNSSKVQFVVHTHVRSDHDHKGIARLITRGRELPGPGDQAFLEVGKAPNYFLTPSGNIRVLEYRQGEYRLRTVAGDQAPEREWQPYAGEPTLAEINRAIRAG